jgi:hypothetical protein
VLEARKADELRFQVVSAVDGSRVNLDGLAEPIRAARMRNAAGDLLASIPAGEVGQERNVSRKADSLSERIKIARQRTQSPETML